MRWNVGSNAHQGILIQQFDPIIYKIEIWKKLFFDYRKYGRIK